MKDYIGPFEGITIWEWLLMFLLILIPIVNVILLCYWAFSGKVNQSKANWARAIMIFSALSALFYFFLYASFITLITNVLSMVGF
jgi:hypothetical protein